MAGLDSSSKGGDYTDENGSQSNISNIKNRFENFDRVATIDAVIAAPAKFKRELSALSPSGILTRFPLITVLGCLLITIFFGLSSGINDCRDGWSSTEDDVEGNQWYGAACFTESSLNVNGDLEVYLPTESQITTDLAEIQENWTTNVMVIYVESDANNVTDYEILKQMDEVERRLNIHPNDNGSEDNVKALLSISTVVKEVNSSAVRVSKAFFSGLATATGNEELSEDFNETIDDNQDILGNYAIPENQNTIDRIIGELPENAQSKLVRGVDVDANEDGEIDENETAKFWNRAVIIVFITQNLDKDGDGIDDYPIGQLIANTQNDIDRLGENNSWDELSLNMTLTGPVPITNAVTEYSFKLFWQIFPLGIVAVAFVLFLFHCDLLQTGRMRPIQGIKVVIISGLPTLCSVLITLGLIGWSGKEVTMTVIIVGPIVLALGVSYGLHITNRYAESDGTPQEKMSEALQSTGRAVFLSAVTTIIGFISLTFTPMAPIQTVGWGLALGIVVVYIMTMLMVPNLTMLLDLKKPSHPPLGVFKTAVNGPVNYSSIALTLFLTLMLVSAMYSRTNVEENIELLEMAPDDPNDQDNPDYDAVRKMKQYSDEFDAGQAGFILVEGDIGATPSFTTDSSEDPFENLQGIDQLEADVNLVNQTTGVSVVFLMKSISVSVNVSGYPILDEIPDATPEPIKDVAELIFGREAAEDATFWEALQLLDSQDDNGGRQSQNFLLYVFYNSLTIETRELFISSNYEKSLVYIDMPFMDVQSTQQAVDEVNRFSAQDRKGDITAYDLSGVAAVTIAVNAEIVNSQWTSLGFALLFTLLTLGFVFRDGYYAFLTTLPVVFTVAMQWMVMDLMDVELSLVTVMIGSILVGVGVDFSIHIGNRVRELGGDLDAIRIATSSTGMSLVEAATCTIAGLACALFIPIPAIQPFIFTIMILLIVAAISALLLLPAIYAMLVKVGWGLTGGSTAMSRKIGLNIRQFNNDGTIDAELPGNEAW